MTSGAILAAAKGKPKVKKKPGWRDKLAAKMQPEEANEFAFKPKPGQSFFQDTEYQTALLALLCKDVEALRRVGHILRMEDFKPAVADPTSKLRWLISYHALDHFRRTGQPVDNMLSSRLKENASQSNMKPDEREALISYGKKLLAMSIVGAGDIIERAAKFKQEIIVRDAIEELIEQQTAGKLGEYEWATISQKVLAALSEGEGTTPTTAADLLEKDFPEPVFLVNPLLPRGLVLLAARPKIGKSWMCLQLAIATATGGKFLGRTVKTPGKVLYCALEDGERRVAERLRWLLGESEYDSKLAKKLGQIEFIHQLPPLNAGGLLLLERKLTDSAKAKAPIVLLVVDHFLAAAGQQKGRDLVRSEYQEIAALRRLSERYSVTIVLVHHLRKMGAADSAECVLGTTAATAAPDALWIITRGAEDRVKKLEISGRDQKERVLEIALNHSRSKRGWSVTGEGPMIDAGPVGRQVMEYLKEAGPQHPSQIAAAMEMTRNTLYEQLHRLRKHGRILKKGGRYEIVQ